MERCSYELVKYETLDKMVEKEVRVAHSLNGKRDVSYNYLDHETKLIFVKDGITFKELTQQIFETLTQQTQQKTYDLTQVRKRPKECVTKQPENQQPNLKKEEGGS
ncbi:hypothetical protein RND71_001344 [Anisodus tanguticus]|uniref:Uncharacterized protein n=1 Tax=Anisodus tanguticus TaxID=243964 RepID=A0AAE1T0Q8_9SOLA|nr:hypothetical protein RND71_001344 [Anisodus tanguticus]